MPNGTILASLTLEVLDNRRLSLAKLEGRRLPGIKQAFDIMKADDKVGTAVAVKQHRADCKKLCLYVPSIARPKIIN